MSLFEKFFIVLFLSVALMLRIDNATLEVKNASISATVCGIGVSYIIAADKVRNLTHYISLKNRNNVFLLELSDFSCISR